MRIGWWCLSFCFICWGLGVLNFCEVFLVISLGLYGFFYWEKELEVVEVFFGVLGIVGSCLVRR